MAPPLADAAPPRVAPGTKLGPYQIVAPIGAGGMGAVFRARDERLRRDVAVKVLPAAFAGDPDRLRRFAEEARAAGGLDHPGILAVHDLGEHEGVPYLVTELLEGQTIRERLAGGAIAPRKAIEWATQIAQALAAAHDKGIVHRDLKPENLFVLHDGRVKILDFGLAKALARAARQGLGEQPVDGVAPTAVAETQSGHIVGTAGYMAPEQARGEEVDARSDLFSLGAVLFEVLAGKPAFPGATQVERSYAVLKHDPPPLPERTPAALGLVVQRLLEKSPAERFQSARDLAFSLQALANLSSTGSVPVPRAKPRRVRPLAAAAAAATALAAAAFLAGRGAAPRPAAMLDYRRLVYRHGSIPRARFAPDGRSVLFAAEFDGAPLQVYETAGDGGRELAVGEPGLALLDVSRGGELALRRGRTVARAARGGTARDLVSNAADAAWAPDGENLAVVVRSEGRSRLELRGKTLYESDDLLERPRVAPDGERVALLAHPERGEERGRVLVVGGAGGARQLGPEWTAVDGLAWGPDGREVWVSASDARSVRAVHALDGRGGDRVLARFPGEVALEDVAGDGRALVIARSGHQRVVGRAPGAREVDLACSDHDLVAGLTPDGQKVLLVDTASGPAPKTFLRTTDGKPAVEIAAGRGWALSHDAAWALVSPLRPWRELVLVPTGAGPRRPQPSGPIAEISGAAFTSNPEVFVVAGSEAGKRQRLWLQTAGQPPRPIGEESTSLASGVSPDDAWVVGRGAKGRLLRVPLGGGAATPLEGLEPYRVAVAGIADGGRALYLLRRGDAGAVVERYDLASRALVKLDGFEDATSLQLARDGARAVVTREVGGGELYLVTGLR